MGIAPLRRTVSLLVVATLVATGTAVTYGQRPQGGGPPGGGPITVDFTALGADGQVVPDLTPADVSIKVAGKVRKVSSLTLKKMEATAGPVSSAPAPFATNAPVAGRSIMFVVDTGSMTAGTERGAKERLETFFQGLSATDRVAFSVAPQDTAQVGFGAGLPAVRAALAKITGVRPAKPTTDETDCRTEGSLKMLRAVMESLGGSDAPTSLVYVSTGLALDVRTTGTSVGGCAVSREQYQAIASAAAVSRVNLFVVQGDEAVTGRDDGLEQLVSVTNAGPVMRLNNLGRLLAESSAYYVASIEPDPSDRPGPPQRLEVKVNREGVSTHARAELALGRSAARPGAAAQKASPRDMLRTPAAFTDLQLRATALVSRGKGDEILILALAEPVDSSVKLTAMSAGLVNQASSLVAQATVDEKYFASYPIPIPMARAAGKYRLRIAATDAEGRSGAVDVDLDANLTPAGPLKLGSILIAGPRGQGYTPLLQFSGDEVAMQVELYGQITGQVTAKIEIAASPDGPPIIESQVGGQGTSEPDKFILNAKVGIEKLAPGDYVVRAIVQLEGQPEGRVFRTLRKLPK